MAENFNPNSGKFEAEISLLSRFSLKIPTNPHEQISGVSDTFWKRILNRALSTSSMGVLSWDFRTREFQCPEHFRVRLGLAGGAPFETRLADHDRETFFETIRRALAGLPIEVRRIRWGLADHRVLAILDAGVDRDGTGAPAKLLLLLQDLTVADEALRVVQNIQKNATDKVAAAHTLLQEVNHRVKNNLQVVCALINSHSDGLEDPAARISFRDIESRVRTIAHLHERLASGFGTLEAPGILRDLASMLARSGALDPGRLALDLDDHAPPLELSQAMPFAMVANELLMNSIQHGNPAAPVSVQLRGQPDGSLRLTIRNGSGMAPPDSGPGLGIEIVRALSRQLGASFHSEFAWNEVACHLVLPPVKGRANG